MHIPFVGEDFRVSNRRLLVVGESHYGDVDDDYLEFTPDVIEKWRAGENLKNLRYFTILAGTLNYTWDHVIDRKSVFKDIAFANYIQKLLPTQKDQPTTLHLEGAERQFKSIVGELDPTHILVTSRRAWEYWLPASDREMITAVYGGKEFQVAFYKTTSGYAGAISVPHLSKYFSPPEWREPIADFLSYEFM